MKITKLQTRDFMGLTGVREYHFPAKITALAMPNGSGKTSILNALRYGLTGDAGAGVMISGKAPKTDVAITIEPGIQVIREVTREGEAKYWYNRKPIAKTALERAISASCKVEHGILKTVTASELLGNMKPQELGNLMLGYIPETLDTTTIISYTPNCTDGMKTILESVLPDGTFGTGTLEDAYKRIYKMRTAAKKSKSDLEATLRIINRTEMPKEGQAALEQMLSDLKSQQEAVTVYRTKLDEYDRAKKQKEDLEGKKKAIEEQLASLSEEPFEEAKLLKGREEMEGIQKDLDALKKTIMTFENTKESLAKALKLLDTPVCPLSEKLHCTTDKTPIKEELTEALKEAEEGSKRTTAQYRELAEKLERASKRIRAMEESRVAAAKRDGLEKNLKDLEETLKTITATEPAKPAIKPVTLTEAEIRAKLDAIKTYEKADQTKKELEEAVKKVEDLEALCAALDPKGIVRHSVTKSYISAFESSVNARAATLKPGMKMKFVQRDGIVPMLDVNGDGMYYPYHTLSGGEKIFMVFLLLDMLNQMCGLNVLFLDELSVLDEGNFTALISVLNSVPDYDQVFITTVDHASLVTALKAVKDIDVVEKL